MRTQRRHKNPRWAHYLAIGLVTVACNEPEPPPAAYIGPTLAAADLGATTADCPATGYVIVDQGTAPDRFPTGIAIARLAPSDTPDAGSPAGWKLDTIPGQEATYWTCLFNRIRDVREVFVLDSAAVPRDDDGIEAICLAARLGDSALCLIYAPADAPSNHAALTGVLYDTETLQPVALLRADAGPADFLSPFKDHFEENQSHEDVNYLVARKFETQLRECVFELVSHDQKTATTRPSPWEGAPTTRPVAAPMPVYVVPNEPAAWE